MAKKVKKPQKNKALLLNKKMRPKVSNGMMHTHSEGVNALRKSGLSLMI